MNSKPKCPECGSDKLQVNRKDKWSGRTKKIEYRCTNCGRMTVNPKYD